MKVNTNKLYSIRFGESILDDASFSNYISAYTGLMSKCIEEQGFSNEFSSLGTEMLDGKYINANGDVVDLTDARFTATSTNLVNVIGNRRIIVNAQSLGYGPTSRAICFFDINELLMSALTGTYAFLEIDIPENAAYVRLLFMYEGASSPKDSQLPRAYTRSNALANEITKHQLESLDSRCTLDSGTFESIEYDVIDKYIRTDGVEVDGGASTDFIKIVGIDELAYAIYAYGNGCIYALYRNDKSLIYVEPNSGKANYYGRLDISSIRRQYPLAYYIRFSTLRSYVLDIRAVKRNGVNYLLKLIDDVKVKSGNFANISDILSSGYFIYTATGKLGALAGGHYSGFIRIDKNSKFLINTRTQQGSCCYATYYLDNLETFISAYGYSTSGSYTADNEIVDCALLLEDNPNANYIRFGSTGNLTLALFKPYSPDEVAEAVLSANVLYNKTWLVIGDSFTLGTQSVEVDEATGKRKTYPWWISTRNKMICKNRALGGESMADDGNPNRTHFCEVFASLSDDIVSADYMTIALGLNDVSQLIGEKTDSALSTLWGAWNTVLSGILDYNPAIKLGIIINDTMSNAIHNAQLSIGEYWGIPVLDLYGDYNVPEMIGLKYGSKLNPYAVQKRNSVFCILPPSTDINHPTTLGHQYRSTVIEDFLRKL